MVQISARYVHAKPRGRRGPRAIFRKLLYRYLLMEIVWTAEFSRATLYCRELSVVKISARYLDAKAPGKWGPRGYFSKIVISISFDGDSLDGRIFASDFILSGANCG